MVWTFRKLGQIGQNLQKDDITAFREINKNRRKQFSLLNDKKTKILPKRIDFNKRIVPSKSRSKDFEQTVWNTCSDELPPKSLCTLSAI